MHTPLKVLLEEKGSLVHKIGPDATVLDAVGLMNDKRVGALLVEDARRPVGIFTERDILQRVVASGQNPAETPVARVMTSDLVVVGPETTVREAMAICTEKRYRHLPVMEGEELVGMISSGDLTRWVTKSQSSEIQHLLRYITGRYPA
jgi:CBS domain-containing protein